ncbi:MAG TPA: class A beta-lactamase, partial [Burkholderiales bacterium]
PGRRQFNTALLFSLGAGLAPRSAFAAAPAAAATASPASLPASSATSPAAKEWVARMHAGLTRIDAAAGGRLGVAVQDMHTGAIAALRGGERFPMCSTFKLLVAALVLKRTEEKKENLGRRIVIRQADMVPNSPITKTHAAGEGMTVAELCAAAIAVSDNTAANLLLKSFGGPAALTHYVRSLGDTITRLDRIEPALNEARPGDARDTTAPLAMLGNLRALLLGEALAPASRAQLIDWLKATTTSARRLRAHLPAGWQAADKTGTGERGTNNDIGILLPPDRAPLLVCVYLTNTKAPLEKSSEVVAAVGELVVREAKA